MNNFADWDDIKNNYKDSLIVGNGASIAISKNFNYSSLYDKAHALGYINNRLKQIFSGFKTTDFETVLYKLLQAKVVTEALSIEHSKITEAYENCRGCLISVIREIHPKYDDIDPNKFIKISNFLKNFKTVISLNYDLILYWSMYHGNNPTDSKGNKITSDHEFKDCFTKPANGDKCFNSDWKSLRYPHVKKNNTTLIFYLHGNLALANFIYNETFEEFEVKITSPRTTPLLETIYDKWKENRYAPLFVCEGENNRKIIAIKNSIYLNTIYHDVFEDLGDTVAIYGWNMNEQDDHVLERLGAANKANPLKKVAISIYENGQESDFMKKARDKVHNKINEKLQIEFYNSKSSKCWNNS